MRRRTTSPENGFSLVEVTVTMSILSVGLLALAGSLGSSIELDEDRLLEIRKSIQIQNVVNTMRTVDFDMLALVFGPGSGNEKFWCDESGQIWFFDPGDTIATGSITIYDDESTLPVSFADSLGGLDLNANGVIDFGPVSDYRILPLRIELTFPNNPGAPTEVGEYFLRP